ncbi:hypothetical protein AJ80_04186 [Polytolypa hystricis UAMH7299]|uniref:Uncharacterized protein n=1 Tax=Polytolypa hystricis (strain UAMH7299) TaxID=1447883 RepID=A0A2B7YD69_POLH7|nr:hypothetical protein AJ80_04186 [Polytolypa hystricis UAMH7299]
MSSTIAGGDNGAPEDELQLDMGEEDQSPPKTNGYGNEEDEVSVTASGPHIMLDDEPVSVTSTQDQVVQETNNSLLDSPGRVSPGPLSSIGRDIGSVDDSGSIPDDTPSLQGSLLSSRSSAFGLRGSPSSFSPSHRRPFDLRFQSRLSSSFSGNLRPLSPSLGRPHSRNSSFASQFLSSTPDLAETPSSPWDVVRWTKLRKITGQAFSEVGKRNFGQPTCIAVSTSIIVGTGKGIILVFDYQQNLKSIIGSGTKAVECGPITSLAISADHTTLAGGHASGNIFTWEVARSARPFLHIPPIPAAQTGSRRSDGHIADVAVIHLGFLGTRHTALVSADDHGMAFSHLATRGMGAVGRTVKTTRILGRYPDPGPVGGKPRKPSSVLAFSPLPLGNVEQSTDSLGLVAMLTPYLLVIVSTTPVARTQYKCGRPKELAAHSALTAALAWFPAIKLKAKNSEASKTKLVYCWSNVLTVLEVSDVKPSDHAGNDKPPSFEFKPRSRWRAEEAIVAVQWISRSVLAVMTITQQLLILEDNSLRMTDSFDLLRKHIYHVDLFSAQLHPLVEQLDEEDESMHGVVADAFYMSFRAYKGRLFLLGVNDISVGSLSNWADRLLALMEGGDFIGAIRLATSYYRGDTEKLTVGLPEEDEIRHEMVQEKLVEMMSASLKYAFGRNEESDSERLQPSQLEDLAEACISACDAVADYDFLFEEVYGWYEENDSDGIFLDVLEPYIVQGSVRTLTPPAVKSLITHYSTNHTVSRLEEIICLLDTTTMDIDQVTTLCKQHNLYDAFIYVWTRTLNDYVGPLAELIDLVRLYAGPAVNGNADNKARALTNATKMFPYLSFTLTGRIYPTGEDLLDNDAVKAKTEVYSFLFSGSSKTHGPSKGAQGDSFSNLRTILLFDTASFMSMLNEAFEDSFLNETGDQTTNGAFGRVSVNRQYLVSLLLEVMESPEFGPPDTIYLDMFIARNLPKYPQYILLSGSTIQDVLIRLCRYPSADMVDDCQLSAEYLLSMYRPPDIQALIPLFKQANFFRILKSTYKAEKLFADLLLTYFEDLEDRDSVFPCINDCLRPNSSLTKKQRREVYTVIKDHAAELADIDLVEAAVTIQNTASDLHKTFLHVLQQDPSRQFQYLKALLEPESKKTRELTAASSFDRELVERYIQLLCQYNPSHVADFIDRSKIGDLKLDAVLPCMESSGVIDAAVILLSRQGEVRGAMDRLTKHLATLEAGLSGILQSAVDSPDSASTAEAVADLIESLSKYTRVGIWLCQEQTSAAKKSRSVHNSGKRGPAALKQPLSFEEELWLDFIEAVVRIARNISSHFHDNASKTAMKDRALSPTSTGRGELVSSFRTLVQQAFTALLTSTTKAIGAPHEKMDISFLRVLRAFLTRAAAASPSLSELRGVIASIFSAYTYEESLLSLANTMLDKDLFVHVDEIAKLRQRGWRPRRQACEVCRQRVWGPASGRHIWEAWETKQVEDSRREDARRLEGSMDRDAASRTKGKGPASRDEAPISHTSPRDDQAAVGLHGPQNHLGGDSVQPSESGEAPADGPLVVFGCRHIYHRSCLVQEDARRGRHEHQHLPQNNNNNNGHGEGPEFTCLALNNVEIQVQNTRPVAHKGEDEEKHDDIKKGTDSNSQVIQDDLLVAWDGPNDPDDPLNWPKFWKWSIVLLTSLGGLVTLMSGVMLTPALKAISKDLNTSPEVANMCLSIFVLAFAFEPMVLASMTELFGRRRVWILCSSCFAPIWTEQYHQSVSISGLHYIALVVGSTFGAQLGAWLIDRLWAYLKRKAGGETAPEYAFL